MNTKHLMDIKSYANKCGVSVHAIYMRIKNSKRGLIKKESSSYLVISDLNNINGNLIDIKKFPPVKLVRGRPSISLKRKQIKDRNFLKDLAAYKYNVDSDKVFTDWFCSLAVSKKKFLYKLGICPFIESWYNIDWLPDGYYILRKGRKNEEIVKVKANKIYRFNKAMPRLTSFSSFNGISLYFNIRDLKSKFKVK